MEHVVIFVCTPQLSTVANHVMKYLHDFYNIIFQIKQKLYIASGSASPPPPRAREKSWIRTWYTYMTRPGRVRRTCRALTSTSRPARLTHFLSVTASSFVRTTSQNICLDTTSPGPHPSSSVQRRSCASIIFYL
jgi:hypothetical protein